MKLETQLFNECKERSLNCSLTYQRINDYSIEIYTGYKDSYKKVFYTDGHLDKIFAIKSALNFIRKQQISKI